MEYLNNFIVSLLITVFGFLLTYFFTKKPRLRFYYSAITEIPIPPTNNYEMDNNPLPANITASKRSFRSHTIAVSNQGNATAHNIRIGHFLLAPLAHSVSPPLHVINSENPKEILVPVLCPGEAFTISYLYPESIHFSHINAYLKCDEGMAQVANMQDVRIKSPFFRSVVESIFFIGILSIVYLCVKIFPLIYGVLMA